MKQNNIKEEIDKILRPYCEVFKGSEFYWVDDVSKELTTLIDKVREETIKLIYDEHLSQISDKQALLNGFINYVYNHKLRTRDMGMLPLWWRERANEYLQSIKEKP